ncbi:hypothetical protein [Nocardia carnea]|uniref:Uncharacterized protein n=1 Tax=Nocardia carnea TaxID=37328 RepID=A0ABW7TM79_9NOCA|nr:hypothetical protein [Nocardia carnea]
MIGPVIVRVGETDSGIRTYPQTRAGGVASVLQRGGKAAHYSTVRIALCHQAHGEAVHDLDIAECAAEVIRLGIQELFRSDPRL